MGIHYNPSKKSIQLTKFIYSTPYCVYYIDDYLSQAYIYENKITPYYIIYNTPSAYRLQKGLFVSFWIYQMFYFIIFLPFWMTMPFEFFPVS